MSRRNPSPSSQRPALSTPHGSVHHGPAWEWAASHKLPVEALAVVLAAALLAVLVYTVQTRPTASGTGAQPNALEVYRALHNYDSIEEVRARRLINPRPVADRSYDLIETMRAQRLVLQGDRSYDAIEAIRAGRLIKPIPTPDHSYDAIETIRANRDLGR